MYFTDAIGIVYGFFIPNHHGAPAMTTATIRRVADTLEDVLPDQEIARWVERAEEDPEQAWLLLEILLISGEQSVIKHSSMYWNGTLFFINGGWIKDGTGGQLPTGDSGDPILLSKAMLLGALRLRERERALVDTLAAALGVEADWLLFQAQGDAEEQRPDKQ